MSLDLASATVRSGDGWYAERSLDRLHLKGVIHEIQPAFEALSESLAPAPNAWLADRLTVLWLQFAHSRRSNDPDALTVWLAETIRLLSDLPFDILASAIDAAVQSSTHNFLPSIGEIRSHADVLAFERRDRVKCLRALIDALADPVATELRNDRWETISRHDAQLARWAAQAAGDG